MSKRKKIKEQEVKTFLDEEINLQEQYGKAEKFITEKKGVLLPAVGAVALLILLVFGFRSWYLPSVETTAQSDLFMAQSYFEKDSFNLALNGDGNFSGFLDVIDNHSGLTNANNLAHYYAGVSYLNLGNYEKAIEYLESFNGKDELVSSMALGALGDAYTAIDKFDKGISYYQKAANNSDNELTSPMYLIKLGAAKEKQGDYAGAKKAYEQLKNKYPESAQARTIDKFIARAEANM